jgi:type VI secretion system protein VasG
LLTTNVGTETIMKLCADPDTKPDPEPLIDALRPELQKSFKPALLGRMVPIVYYPISDDVLRLIIGLQLKKIENRIMENHRSKFTCDDAVVSLIAGRCTDVDSGARNVYNILTGTMLPDMSAEVLSKMANGEAIDKIHVGVKDDKFTYDIS